MPLFTLVLFITAYLYFYKKNAFKLHSKSQGSTLVRGRSLSIQSKQITIVTKRRRSINWCYCSGWYEEKGVLKMMRICEIKEQFCAHKTPKAIQTRSRFIYGGLPAEVHNSCGSHNDLQQRNCVLSINVPDILNYS